MKLELVHHMLISAANNIDKEQLFISGRLEKSDEAKDSFYEELEQVFQQFPKYRMKMLLGDFNVKVGRKNNFKANIWTGESPLG